MATCSAIRMVLQRQVGLVRRGLFGFPCRLLQMSSYNLSSEEKQNPADSRNEEFDSARSESANKKYFGGDDGAAFIDVDEDQDTDVRETILNAALEHVDQLGWSPEAIEAGARAVGLSAMAEGMFPRGAGDLVLHFTEDCNVRLADHLVSQSRSAGEEKRSGVPLQKSSQIIIRDAVEVRLRMLIPFIDHWPQAMGLMLLPQNAPDAMKNVAYLVDEIWYHAGDTSTDINWYTKRGVLAGLYGATELYMVTDRSSDFEDTWSFLDRRMSDIGLLIGAKETLEKAGSDAAELLSAAFTTVRNMSGLNRRNR